jgi:hypothetical protein
MLDGRRETKKTVTQHPPLCPQGGDYVVVRPAVSGISLAKANLKVRTTKKIFPLLLGEGQVENPAIIGGKPYEHCMLYPYNLLSVICHCFLNTRCWSKFEEIID